MNSFRGRKTRQGEDRNVRTAAGGKQKEGNWENLGAGGGGGREGSSGLNISRQRRGYHLEKGGRKTDESRLL